MTDRTNKYRLAGLRVEHDSKSNTDMGWQTDRQTWTGGTEARQRTDRNWRDRR